MEYTNVVKFVLDKIKRDNIGAYAAQAALFIIMSAIPFLLVLIYLIRFTPVKESMILSGIEMIIPGYVSPWIVSVVDEVYTNSGAVLAVAIVFAVYSSAKALQSLRYGLNIVYDIEETRNWFVLRFRAMLETFMLVVAIVLLMVLLVFGKKIQNMLTAYAPIVSVIMEGILKMRMVILFFVLIVFFTFIYKVLPNRKATFRSQLVGAVGCSAAWYVFSFGLSVYINYFNGFSLYGSLTTIVLLMFWLYISMYIFLVCGEINNVFEILMREVKRVHRMKKEEKRRKKQELLEKENEK